MSPVATPERKTMLGKDRTFTQPGRNNALSYVMLAALVLLIVLGAVKMLAPKKDTGRDSVQVVGAKQDITPGSRINFSSMHYLTIPKAYMDDSMYTSYKQLFGRMSSTYIRKGDPITKTDLLPKDSLGALLNVGERAITLKLDPEMLLDHEIAFGDHVDVIVSSSADNKRYTRTICQNLRVLLAVPKDMMASNSGRANEGNRVTLAAGAADCERINQAADTGKIRLVLRSPGAAEHEYLSGSDQRDILPSFALKELAEKAGNLLKDLAPSIPAPPLNSFVPAAQPAADISSIPSPPDMDPAPLQWVVEMFSGSKKETYAIPSH